MVALSQVRERGQLTLPQEALEEAGFTSGDVVAVRVTGEGTMELRVLPRLTAAELIARYPIEGPIDEEAARDAWQAVAAKDVIGE